jgi:hypothetical protein
MKTSDIIIFCVLAVLLVCIIFYSMPIGVAMIFLLYIGIVNIILWKIHHKDGYDE